MHISEQHFSEGVNAHFSTMLREGGRQRTSPEPDWESSCRAGSWPGAAEPLYWLLQTAESDGFKFDCGYEFVFFFNNKPSKINFINDVVGYD